MEPGPPFSDIYLSSKSLQLPFNHFSFSPFLFSLNVGRSFALPHHILPSLLPMSSPNVWNSNCKTWLCFFPPSFMLCNLFPGDNKYRKVSRLNEVLLNYKKTLSLSVLGFCNLYSEMHHWPWRYPWVFCVKGELLYVVPLFKNSRNISSYLSLFISGLPHSIWQENISFSWNSQEQFAYKLRNASLCDKCGLHQSISRDRRRL